MDLISIIIPVYNIEKYLDKCLESVVNQDYPNLEVILINDGSTDDSQKIIDIYAKKIKNCVCLNQENKGVSAARNEALKIAKGEYITFIDSDDIITDDYCSHLMNIIGNCDIAVAGRKNFVNNVFIKSKTSSCQLVVSGIEALKFLMVGKYNSRPVWGKLYKRNVIGGLADSFQKYFIKYSLLP